jgi:dTDP-4-amino-4,6-dideoxygalactose transaminase
MAEKISKEMVNLPTHRNVDEKDAEFIAKCLNEWM